MSIVKDGGIDPCGHIHVPSHMKGWEAFGCVGVDDAPEAPLVRPLGRWTGHPKTKWDKGTEKWGPGETSKGVSSIEIHAFADSPTGAYIYVCGTTELGVTSAWHRASAAFTTMQRVIWPGSYPQATEGDE